MTKEKRHYKKDDQWVREHLDELVKTHPGKYVAVARGELAGVHSRAAQAERQSFTRYPHVLPSVIRVPGPDDDLCV